MNDDVVMIDGEGVMTARERERKMSNGEDEVRRGVGWGCGPAAWVNERIVNVRTLNSSTVHTHLCVCVCVVFL